MVTTTLGPTTNCSWYVVPENYGKDNNSSPREIVCLSEMPVYSDIMWAVTGIFCWVAIGVACYNVYRHFDNYAEPKFQVYIVRIICIIPVYALCSWLSLRFYEGQLYIELFRDCFEAYIIWCFLRLIMEWMGGHTECVAKLETQNRMPHPWPFGPCCRRIILNATFIRRCQQGTLQFVILKPFMAIVSVIMLLIDEYYNPIYDWIMNIVYNISYTWALYVLFLLYMATKSFLKAHDPVKKFLAVKVVIFMTYYQALLFEILPLDIFNVTSEETKGWSNALLCLEMLIFSILHIVAFKAPTKDPERARPIDSRAAEAGVSSTKLRDIEAKRTLKNLQNVFSLTDVARDTIYNFNPKYDKYIGGVGTVITEPQGKVEEDSYGRSLADEIISHDQEKVAGKSLNLRHKRTKNRLEKSPRETRRRQFAGKDSKKVDTAEEAAISKAWTTVQAKLEAEIEADSNETAGSSLKQEAMKLPLHLRRHGGYTRTIPTTYAIDEESIDVSSNEVQFNNFEHDSDSSGSIDSFENNGNSNLFCSKAKMEDKAAFSKNDSRSTIPQETELVKKEGWKPLDTHHEHEQEKSTDNTNLVHCSSVVTPVAMAHLEAAAISDDDAFSETTTSHSIVAINDNSLDAQSSGHSKNKHESGDNDDGDNDDESFDMQLAEDILDDSEPSSDELDLGLADVHSSETIFA